MANSNLAMVTASANGPNTSNVLLGGAWQTCGSRYSACTCRCAAPQVVQATDVGGNTVNLTAAMNFCGTQVYSTSGVLLPAASYGAVPETYVAGMGCSSWQIDVEPWPELRNDAPAWQYHLCTEHGPDWRTTCAADVAALRTLAASPTSTPAAAAAPSSATPTATPSAGKGPRRTAARACHPGCLSAQPERRRSMFCVVSCCAGGAAGSTTSPSSAASSPAPSSTAAPAPAPSAAISTRSASMCLLTLTLAGALLAAL